MATETINPTDQAVDTLLAKVRGPAILEKLAHDWNIVPKSPAQAGQLLELADELHNAKLNESVKTAAAGNDPFLDRAINGVRQATGQPRIPEEMFKEAAANVINTDGDVAKAAMTYIDHLVALENQAARQ